MRLAFSALVGAALICSGLPAAAAPGDDIGATVRVVDLVTGAYAKDLRHLAKGDPVRQDELIEVSDDGLGEIRLRDATELALGPGARLKLDQFVYDPDISGGAIVVDLVRGAFRFITGVAAKPSYVIRTPTAAITVRGTIFDVFVELSGISWLLLIEGAVEVCNEQRDCRALDEPGKLIRITPDGVVSDSLRWADLPTAGLPFATAFPFIVTPPEVDPEPILTADDVVGGTLPDGPDDDDDDSDDAGDDSDDDIGPGPPGAPLTCWDGWKQVHEGWSADGWRVKKKHRGGLVVYCARREGAPGGGIGIPLPPTCVGGKIALQKSLPPRWRCICPEGKKRHRIGAHAYVCKGKPGGGKNPKKECLAKGWHWTGAVCIPKLGKCKKGTVGKWPDCKKIVLPPKTCKPGTIGKWPNCKKLTLQPKKAKQPKQQFKTLQKSLKKLQLQKKKD